MLEINSLLAEAVDANASDLHLVTGAPPALRIHGEIFLLKTAPLTREQNQDLVEAILNEQQLKKLEETWELGFSYYVPDLGRFRVNVYYQKGNLEMAVRVGQAATQTLEELGLPPVVSDLARKGQGLILITGPTGVGKTTTFNSMIDLINSERRGKIITIEDPIEFVHEHKQSIVVQQEVESDVRSFSRALIHVLRQDPDVIGVGEMRDLETMATAITAAETGHLVIATLHTIDATQTVDRIIDVFPPYAQPQITAQLSSCLLGIVSQQLLPRADKAGRIVACEIMIANSAIRNIIRENKTQKLYNMIQTGSAYQMQTMDAALKDLYQKGLVGFEAAMTQAKDPMFIQGKV
jgi:twitching motility protein PilT